MQRREQIAQAEDAKMAEELVKERMISEQRVHARYTCRSLDVAR